MLSVRHKIGAGSCKMIFNGNIRLNWRAGTSIRNKTAAESDQADPFREKDQRNCNKITMGQSNCWEYI